MISDQDFLVRYGPGAVVAGGSVGMGAGYSRQLARRGLNVVLVAEAPEPLQPLAAALAREHGVETRAIVLDLAAANPLAVLDPETHDLEIGLVVYNAAHSIVGRFLDVALADKLKMLEVNCRGPVLLAHHFGTRMAKRRRGGIILVSSLAGFQGQAMVGTYAATKAFDLVLAETLWDEPGDALDVRSTGMNLSDVRLDDPDSFAAGVPHQWLRLLRAEAPLYFHPERKEAGFWCITKYEDLKNISKDPATFSSARGGTNIHTPPE